MVSKGGFNNISWFVSLFEMTWLNNQAGRNRVEQGNQACPPELQDGGNNKNNREIYYRADTRSTAIICLQFGPRKSARQNGLWFSAANMCPIALTIRLSWWNYAGAWIRSSSESRRKLEKCRNKTFEYVPFKWRWVLHWNQEESTGSHHSDK